MIHNKCWIQLLVVSFTAACTLSCKCLQQLVRYFSVFWVAIFFRDIFCHECRTVAQSTPSRGNFRRSDLPSVILSTSLFQSKVVIKHCQKKMFIRWLLTLFKSAKKNKNNWDALRIHFTQAYRRLDTLPTIINSCYYSYLDQIYFYEAIYM